MDWQPPAPLRRRPPQRQQPRPLRQPPRQRPQLPSRELQAFLFSRRNYSVRYVKSRSQFWYKPDPGRDEWKRAYGLTYMLRHAFWPDYDRNDPGIAAAIRRLKQQYYSNLRKRREEERKERRRVEREAGIRRPRQPPQRKGSKSTQELQRLALQQSQGPHGIELGELVHKQLHVWARDRYLGTREYGRSESVAWPPDPRTTAIIAKLTELGVDVRYGEMLIYDSRVPVGTSIDLVGWSAQRQAVVLIEIKTGSKWNMEMGNAPMRGRAPAVVGFNNSPLNQARVQLTTTRAIVEGFYGVQRVEGLLLWANQWAGLEPGTKRTVVDARWLSPRLKRVGRIMLGELHRHLKARGGRAWADPKV